MFSDLFNDFILYEGFDAKRIDGCKKLCSTVLFD